MVNLNSPHYQNPEDAHPWAITEWASVVNTTLLRRWLHVPSCDHVRDYKLLGHSPERWEGVGCRANVDVLCGCVPLQVPHVCLPDGTRRYQPGGAQDYNLAVVCHASKGWCLRFWAKSLQEGRFLIETHCLNRAEWRLLKAGPLPEDPAVVCDHTVRDTDDPRRKRRR